MKKLMKSLTKRQKLVVLFSSVVLVCALSIGTLYVTDVLPGQTKGVNWGSVFNGCKDANCSCHTVSSTKNTCNGCSSCVK